MSGLLDGVKVISMELMEAMPSASVWMADWGAEVIKVEPLTGEMFRGTRRVQGMASWIKLDHGEANWAFELINRNKKSIALDLKKEEGRAVLYELVKQTDVFMSNYERSTIQKLKLEYEQLRKLNPSLVYAFLSGYGTSGPDKDERGFDQSAAWARSGIMDWIGEPGSIPAWQPSGMSDRTVAIHALAGVLAALLHKEKTGEGQRLEVSLYQSSMWTNGKDIQAALVNSPLPRHNRATAGNPIWNQYKTKDGRWIVLAMLQPDPYWSPFCKAIDMPDLEKDPSFDGLEARRKNCEELVSILDEVIASKTLAEWDAKFKRYGLVYSRVQTAIEVIDDPQAVVNDFFVDLPHPGGHMKTIANPVKFYQNPATIRHSAPEVGQHTEEVILSLGRTWDDISRLKEQGVIL